MTAAQQSLRQPPLAIVLRVVLPFACGYFLSYGFRTVNAIISPDLTASLGLNATDLGLLTSVYFLAFASFQLPLGILLDRFGPRRVEASLLLFAALGAVLFALSDARAGLVIGRALIGLGVSACLMASFKAFVIWFPPERLPMVNGWVLAAGGLGALTATAPVEAALHFTDWRGLFWGLGIVTFIVAVAIFVIVPERESHGSVGNLRTQLRGLIRIYSDSYFWRIAPVTVLSQTAFLAVQGLWAGPWLKDVAGLSRAEVANHLFFTAAAMVTGFLLMGNVAYRLSRLGIRNVVVAGAGMLIFMVVQLCLTLQLTALTLPLWVLFGFFGTSGLLSFAVLSHYFPAELSGRVSTAVNVMVFVSAFIAQWGIGAIVNFWPTADGYEPRGYQAAFALVLALQGLTFVWFIWGEQRQSRRRDDWGGRER